MELKTQTAENPYYYKKANETVDLIMVSPEKKVLLIKRKANVAACPSQWAIPGGFVDTDAKPGQEWKPGFETPEEAAVRELSEETKMDITQLDLSRLKFNGVYEGGGRDPRDNITSWSKSNSYYYVMNEQEANIVNTVKGIDGEADLDDAERTGWFSFDEILEMKLAFDHNKIISDAKNKMDAENKNRIKP